MVPLMRGPKPFMWPLYEPFPGTTPRSRTLPFCSTTSINLHILGDDNRLLPGTAWLVSAGQQEELDVFTPPIRAIGRHVDADKKRDPMVRKGHRGYCRVRYHAHASTGERRGHMD